MNRALCLSCSQSCLFDPSTDTHSSLKWIGVSMLIFFIYIYIYFFFMCYGPQCQSHSSSIYFEHGQSAYALSFKLIDSTKQVFTVVCEAKPKLDLNDPTGRESSTLAASNNPSGVDLGLRRKPKVPISLMLDLCWFHFCQKGPLSVHQLFYNQFLPDPTLGDFSTQYHPNTHTYLCVYQVSVCLQEIVIMNS